MVLRKSKLQMQKTKRGRFNTRFFVLERKSADERTLAGQNVSFDRDFLRLASERAGHTSWPFAYRTIDTHTLCYMHMIEHGIQPPVAKHRSALDLDRVLNYCGIPSQNLPRTMRSQARFLTRK